jgi:hypothetical protein
MNDQSAALVLPTGFETVNPVEASTEVISRKVKCKPNQGKLNRLIAKAQVQITAMGHAPRRFTRDYELVVALYECPNCKTLIFVNPKSDLKMIGVGLTTPCTALPAKTEEVTNG